MAGARLLNHLRAQPGAWFSGSLSLVAGGGVGVACASSSSDIGRLPPGAKKGSGAQRLKVELQKIRPNEIVLREKWLRDEADGWRKLPPRAWPEYQPKAEEVPALRSNLEAQRCPPAGTKGMTVECVKATFDLASGLVFAMVDQPVGVVAYQGLASAGDVDSMVAIGVCLTEGLGVDRDESQGLNWLRRASSLGNAQGHFEYGQILFMGACGVDEDEPAGFALFKKAADLEHVSGMFMVADCLLEGVGCGSNADVGTAVPLLLAAAEKGHRGARQHLRQLLDGEWVGFGG